MKLLYVGVLFFPHETQRERLYQQADSDKDRAVVYPIPCQFEKFDCVRST